MIKSQNIIPIERIASRIYLIRGEKVMLDSDLAEMYEVTTAALNQAVKRNIDRFPDDFMFQLNELELESLISQSVISNDGRGGRRKLPWAFTEPGVAMLSSVLHSKRAVQVNIAIVRAFIKIRQILASNRDLARKVEQHDHQIKTLFDAVQKLLTQPDSPKKHSIGYIRSKD